MAAATAACRNEETKYRVLERTQTCSESSSRRYLLLARSELSSLQSVPVDRVNRVHALPPMAPTSRRYSRTGLCTGCLRLSWQPEVRGLPLACTIHKYRGIVYTGKRRLLCMRSGESSAGDAGVDSERPVQGGG